MDKGLEHFNELRRLADSEEPEVVKNYYLGIGDEFEFEVEEELTFEEDEGEPFTELIQTIHVYLDDEEVYEFERTYQGFNSDDGDDWEVEEIDNTIDSDVAGIFEACGIELDIPDVPKADDQEFEEEEE
ncbi:hypothetical protein PSHI8_15400 [Polynucleobacter sp. SHI8]|uniref:hypothetical protein n=1 Tax=unclassified Polynucleobacter TaxID=2640945 RepID=UPI002493CC51|nr:MULTISPECIES: hypothetical protein [unclassified Polynucleobacter]BDW11457.1 hypothetical protein PSHI2_15390 [Polynucleobacter sp. SHI2]BDW13904.1 hypothetical protein PSHI8_15400 [Polynucleobacter sp. SHI8]